MKEKTPSPYKIEPIESGKEETLESPRDVPIINFIRHGETTYRERKDRSFVFDPTADGFELDPEHLDLTQEGIDNIRETAAQLAEEIINKENEAVLIVASPNFRAQSSALIVEEVLRERGITLLNDEGEISRMNSLHAIDFKTREDEDTWMPIDEAYRAEEGTPASISPIKAHNEIARRMGKELKDLIGEDYDDIAVRQERFFRHMTNIYDYLSEETKEKLEGKTLRIVSVGHEEFPAIFMERALGTEQNLKKGQILEMRPSKPLRADDENVNEVVLYPHHGGGEFEAGSDIIVRKFNIENKK